MKNGSNKENNNDDFREVHCSESQWRKILLRAQNEVERFLKFYETLPVGDDEDRLDKCAGAMGWQFSIEESKTPIAEIDTYAGENKNPAPLPIYSLQNMPECIAVNALCKFIKKRWADLFMLPYGAGKLPARVGASLLTMLASTEQNMMFAIDAMDAGEYALALTHAKLAHAALNKHFAEMESVPAVSQNAVYAKLVAELYQGSFDLRDLCLRLIRDARGEIEGSDDEWE